MIPFKITKPSPADIAAFHEDGYIAFHDVMHDDYREAVLAWLDRLVDRGL